MKKSRSILFFIVCLAIILLTIVVRTGVNDEKQGGYIEAFREIWGIVHKQYPLFDVKGIDWQAKFSDYDPLVRDADCLEEFRCLLAQMFRELQDGHTHIVSNPRQITPKGRVPIPFIDIEGCIYVSTFPSKHSTNHSDIRPGMELLAVDGLAVEESIAQIKSNLYWSTREAGRYNAIALLTYGSLKESVELEFSCGNTFVLDRKPYEQEGFTHYIISDTFGYIRIPTWSYSARPLEYFEKALEEVKHTQALIIDLRGNSGGDDRLASRAAARLIQERTLFTRYQRRFVTLGIGWFTPPIPRRISPGGPWQYENPVVILIDEGVASAAEIFVQGLHHSKRAITIGRTTAGSMGNPQLFSVADIEFRVSTRIEYNPQGQIMEGLGIQPHVMVRGLQEINEGRDPFLEKALVFLQDGIE